MAALRESVSKSGWTQAQAPERLGNGHARVADLMRKG
ncbi:MAG TPA: hypothetical protein PK752_18565 [Accumulibacter sp.]|nr:hypothetical protein [Accumulibacter sp.]HRD90235.1 hypothetical protein [Accumulibacter sp.]